jgi:signal transduction histidine kinase
MLLPGAGQRELRRHLAREPKAAAVARRELESLLDELSRAEVDTAALLTTELISNSVRHAGPSAGALLELDVLVTLTLVRVTVSDGGDGFTPDVPASGRPTDGHWGLQIVDRLADRWGVRTGAGTTVWFEIDR